MADIMDEPRSEAFQRGYDAALAQWKLWDEVLSYDPENPFPIDSDEERGFECAVCDLTQTK